jgi:hypothetical protein
MKLTRIDRFALWVGVIVITFTLGYRTAEECWNGDGYSKCEQVSK